MPVRTLVAWCPDWPLVAAGVPLDQPAAVVHANRVVACSPAARGAGVANGLRRREAQARCPGLEVRPPDPAGEARAFEPVVAAACALTPRVEVAEPGTCAFATRGPSRYHGGDAALAERARSLAAAALAERIGAGHAAPGATVQVGVADGPFAATLAARSPRAALTPVVVPPGQSAAFLAPWPVATLDATLDRPDLADVLVRLGLPTLGDLAALAPADVVARFGAAGVAAHRLASGLDERPPVARQPPPDLAVVAELDPPAERVDTAAFVAKALADDLHRRLDERGVATTRVVIEAETEHGERLVRCWRHPGGSAGALADRVRWQLEGWLTGTASTRPTAGISRLQLSPDDVVAATGRQLGFWGGEAEVGRRAARALARVQGLLGPEAVTVPERRGGRGPGERVAQVPAGAVDPIDRHAGPSSTMSSMTGPWPGHLPAPSPATVHVPPLPVEVLDAAAVPVGVTGRGLVTASPARVAVAGGRPAEVVAWAGPWPADERWWDPPARRRRARLQVLTATGTAHLLALETGRWWLEATYD